MTEFFYTVYQKYFIPLFFQPYVFLYIKQTMKYYGQLNEKKDNNVYGN
jgi:hypothetical protein